MLREVVAAAKRVRIDLFDGCEFRRWNVGLRSCAFVGGKGISDRSFARTPDAALHTRRLRERRSNGRRELLLDFVGSAVRICI